ncbi:uncharacterized protein LOC108158219 isoform X1 [Drosophila miranda]|uniref:uncharacterized protein LOC108158219 isoform X1 n=1 Tax=Drosophila miranda TaxID=7229 RepID=UPI0007E6B51D|nr:uncharacterized protein LOC108158219 isoform X1 [Drosophila miranda]
MGMAVGTLEECVLGCVAGLSRIDSLPIFALASIATSVWLRLPFLMRARKPNAQEREQLRRQRSEARLIMARCKERGFEYVVNPPEMPTVAFGRKIKRSPSGTFLEEKDIEPPPGPNPFTYDCMKEIGFKYPSKAGFSALASKTSRMPAAQDLGYPPLGTYDVKESRDQYAYTFNKQVLRQEPKWMCPGPSSYMYHLKYPKWNVDMAFGTRNTIWPAVAVFCGAFDTSQCMACGEKPVGDYFHSFSSDKDICRKCMHAIQAVIKKCDLGVVERWFKQRDIKQFVPVRSCSFFHDHNGTTAATERTTRKVLRDKIRVENYLYRFTQKTV